MSSAAAARPDQRTWEVHDRDIVDRGTVLGPMPTPEVLDAIMTRRVRLASRCRAAGTEAWIALSQEPAFAPCWRWTRGNSWLCRFALLTGAAAGLLLLLMTMHEPMSWSLPVGVLGFIALMAALARRWTRRRAMLQPALAGADRYMLRRGLALGFGIPAFQMIVRIAPPRMEHVPLHEIVPVLAITALTYWLLWLHQLRDERSTTHGSPA